MARVRQDPRERFWGKVEKTETCWNWIGNCSNGYGHFNIGGHPVILCPHGHKRDGIKMQDGKITPFCLICTRAHGVNNYAEHRVKRLEYRRQYRERNRAILAEKQRQYQARQQLSAG